MSHRCKKCGRSFRKADHLWQHERVVHVERPRQQREEAMRRRFASDRHAASDRGMAERPPELRPFGSVTASALLADIVDANAMLLATMLPGATTAAIKSALEPPTIDGEIA